MEAILVCRFNDCNKYLSKPVFLPCGKNICKNHVDKMLEENLFTFKCIFCENFHEIPDNGFPMNYDLMNIISLNLHLSESEKKAREFIKKLETDTYDFSFVANDPESFIFEYVSDVKNKIDEERERLIWSINSISDDMISRLNDFENDCKMNLKNSNDAQEVQKKRLENLSNTIATWKDDLRNSKIEKQKLKAIYREVKKAIKENEAKCLDYKNSLLNGKGCYFHPGKVTFEDELFGVFKIDESLGLKLLSETKNNTLVDSLILTESQSLDLINLCGFDKKSQFKLIYRATRDGFKTADFHRKCDGIEKTLIVIKDSENSNIFGGYTCLSWDCSVGYKADKNSFIFSLKNMDNKPLKFTLNPLQIGFSVFIKSDYGPTFGGGHDLYIANDSNLNKNSYSKLGFSFTHFHQQYITDKILAGSKYFMTSEIEVYQMHN